MPAVITPHFRRRNAQRVYEAAQSGTDKYYIGLGKNDPWADDDDANTYVIPTGSDLETSEAKMNLIALKKVDLQDSQNDLYGTDDNISYVVPNVKWTSGALYKSWDPSNINSFYADSSANPCYTIYNNCLFICVKASLGTSTSAPDASQTLGTIFTQGDGYSWVKIQDSTNVSSHPLLTKSYYPIFNITNSPTASSGKIIRVDIVDSGAGMSDNASITKSVLGDGSGGSVSVTISGGVVTSVTVSASGTGYTFGSIQSNDFTVANATTYRPPAFRVICAPKNGFGSDRVNQLPTWFLGFTSTFDGEESGQFLIDAGTDYRQICLLKNPSFNSDSQGLNTTCLLKVNYTSGSASHTLVSGDVIEFYNSGNVKGRAFVDYVGVSGNQKYVYVHQNYSSTVNLGSLTGSDSFKWINPSTGIADATANSTFTSVSLVQPEYVKGSGEVVFLENRGPIKRNASQVESIKIILQF